MNAAPAALFMFLFLGLLILCGTCIALAAILRGGFSKRRQRLEADEARLIQELHGSLERLERRIDALETILLEKKEKSL